MYRKSLLALVLMADVYLFVASNTASAGEWAVYYRSPGETEWKFAYSFNFNADFAEQTRRVRSEAEEAANRDYPSPAYEFKIERESSSIADGLYPTKKEGDRAIEEVRQEQAKKQTKYEDPKREYIRLCLQNTQFAEERAELEKEKASVDREDEELKTKGRLIAAERKVFAEAKLPEKVWKMEEARLDKEEADRQKRVEGLRRKKKAVNSLIEDFERRCEAYKSDREKLLETAKKTGKIQWQYIKPVDIGAIGLSNSNSSGDGAGKLVFDETAKKLIGTKWAVESKQAGGGVYDFVNQGTIKYSTDEFSPETISKREGTWSIDSRTGGIQIDMGKWIFKGSVNGNRISGRRSWHQSSGGYFGEHDYSMKKQ